MPRHWPPVRAVPPAIPRHDDANWSCQPRAGFSTPRRPGSSVRPLRCEYPGVRWPSSVRRFRVCRLGGLRCGCRRAVCRLARARIRVTRLHDHNRGNGMLENQLLLVIGLENQRVLVEALDAARKLHATEQVQRNGSFILARVVEKAVLDVLRWFVHGISHIRWGRHPKSRACRLTIVHPTIPQIHHGRGTVDRRTLAFRNGKPCGRLPDNGRLPPAQRGESKSSPSYSAVSAPILSWHCTQNLAHGTASSRLAEIGSPHAAHTP